MYSDRKTITPVNKNIVQVNINTQCDEGQPINSGLAR